MKEEICEECIGTIGFTDRAYVYEGRIVCEQCDRKLRQGENQDRISPDAEDTWKAQQVQESPDAEDTWKAQQVQESPAVEDTWQARESEELFDSVEAQEQNETLEVQEPQQCEEPHEVEAPEELEEAKGSEELFGFRKPQESKEFPAAEDTWKTQESEEIFELLQRQESEEPGELKEAEETMESRELEEPLEFKEVEESTELHEPNETEEPIAGPVEAEETADVSEVDSAKPLPRRRKHISTRESKLLPFLFVIWTLLCFFMLFYVPDRYAEVLSGSIFGDKLQLGGFADDCLIIFFMVLWFFGALGFYVAIIGSEKDERIDEKLRILKLLGF